MTVDVVYSSMPEPPPPPPPPEPPVPRPTINSDTDMFVRQEKAIEGTQEEFEEKHRKNWSWPW